MRGKKRLMDGAGKVNVWHESERYWDRRVHTGVEERGEMGDKGLCSPSFSIPSFQLQNSGNQCFVPSGQLVVTVLYFCFFLKDYLTGSYIYIMNFSCFCPQFSSLLLPSLWNPLLNRSPLYIKELS